MQLKYLSDLNIYPLFHKIRTPNSEHIFQDSWPIDIFLFCCHRMEDNMHIAKKAVGVSMGDSMHIAESSIGIRMKDSMQLKLMA